MQQKAATVVVIATGGTIAGRAASPDEHLDYAAARIGVDDLIASTSTLAGVALEAEQLAQVDSKDMTFAIWRALAGRIAHHLARDEVAGVVVTHGTDTMEETAWFLARVLAAGRPVVLTGAMRPSTAREADGPANLGHAIRFASQGDAAPGVVVLMAGEVHAAGDVRKVHGQRPSAFTSGDLGPLARLVDGIARPLRAVPAVAMALDATRLPADEALWPWVEIVASGAGVGRAAVDALVAAGVDGLVVAATGNGTVHARLEPALKAARAAGVSVLLSTRCIEGGIVAAGVRQADDLESAGDLTPPKARAELIARLLAGGARPRRG